MIEESVTRAGDYPYVNTYFWGEDLSGNEPGAGGVGGLLAASNGLRGMEYFAHDGNGNVTNLFDVNGNIRVSYTYDAFGQLTGADGQWADTNSNPFHFSTKYTDTETALLYYGYRYYDSKIGRWISRDPIGENGGLNVYRFVDNQPTADGHASCLADRSVFV